MQKEVYKIIAKEIDDPIVERRTCPATGEEFAIFASEKKFLEAISPVLG